MEHSHPILIVNLLISKLSTIAYTHFYHRSSHPSTLLSPHPAIHLLDLLVLVILIISLDSIPSSSVLPITQADHAAYPIDLAPY